VSKSDKLVKRFKNKPNDFTYDELCRLMKGFGYIEDSKGKSSGSRVCFYNVETGHVINMHKPHPGSILKKYQIEAILEDFERRNLL
jgi:hypothetical protein